MTFCLRAKHTNISRSFAVRFQPVGQGVVAEIRPLFPVLRRNQEAAARRRGNLCVRHALRGPGIGIELGRKLRARKRTGRAFPVKERLVFRIVKMPP